MTTILDPVAKQRALRAVATARTDLERAVSEHARSVAIANLKAAQARLADLEN